MLKKFLCMFFVVGSSLFAASQNGFTEGNIGKSNQSIVNSLDTLYVNRILYPASMNEVNKISFTVVPEKSSYVANLIGQFYVAPMNVKVSDSGVIVKIKEDLFEGDFIGEYVGELKENNTYLEFPLYSRASVMRLQSNPHKVLIIDASQYGNELKFIKKSHDAYNCKWLNVLGEDGMAHVVCIANRFIEEGEELIVYESIDRIISDVQKELRYKTELLWAMKINALHADCLAQKKEIIKKEEVILASLEDIQEKINYQVNRNNILAKK